MTQAAAHDGTPEMAVLAAQLAASPAAPVSAPTPKGQAMRERLLAAAADAFAAHGYAATRVADIVRLAGTSHGNFYRHFPDRNAVLMGVLERLYATLSHATRRAPAAGPGARSSQPGLPDEAELVRRNIAFFHLYARHRDLLRVAREAAAVPGSAGFLHYWLRLRRIFIDRNTAWIDGLRAGGQIAADTDARLTAEALAAMTEQLAYVEVGLAATCPDAARLDALGTICGRMMHRYLAAAAPVGPA